MSPLQLPADVPVDRRRGRKWWVVPAAIATTCALTVCLVALLLINADIRRDENARADENRMTQTNGCERQQVQRGLQLMVLRDNRVPLVELFEQYLPILDCRKTYFDNQGKAVPLPEDLQACWMKLLAERYWLTNAVTTDPVKLGPLCP